MVTFIEWAVRTVAGVALVGLAYGVVCWRFGRAVDAATTFGGQW